MTTTLLLDSDLIAYQFASSAQASYNFGDTGTCTHVDDFELVAPLVDKWITAVVDKLNADAVVVCLSVPTAECFRLSVLPTYKSNRKAVIRPAHLQAVKDYMATNYKSYIRDSLEADDLLGILATHPTLIKGDKVVVTEDKDLMTVPCNLFRPKRDSKPKAVTLKEANYYHLYQSLIGDSTDGYRGCPGIGPVKAELILRNALPGAEWSAVVATYESKGLTEEEALVQARVARICRADDYDFKNKEVKLWTPHK